MKPVRRIHGHETCSVFPHLHVKFFDGKTVKTHPCSGRFWCENHEWWFAADPCHGVVPPTLAHLQENHA